MFPEDGSDSEQLLAEADRRMYRDKQQKRGDSEWLAKNPQKKRPVT
jgi:predicted signal transduction protein with EAL and GGDEF domain